MELNLTATVLSWKPDTYIVVVIVLLTLLYLYISKVNIGSWSCC